MYRTMKKTMVVILIFLMVMGIVPGLPMNGVSRADAALPVSYMTAESSDPIITSVAGNGTAGYSGDGGLATEAKLKNPSRTAFDSKGNLYIADTYNQRIRKVASDGTISTVAGSGISGYGGDGGQATFAQLRSPFDVALDGNDNLYIADTLNDRIRKVAPDGTISTVAGTGVAGYGADGVEAINAPLKTPYGIAVDGSGNLYIAELNTQRIRKVTIDGMIGGHGHRWIFRRQRTCYCGPIEIPL